MAPELNADDLPVGDLRFYDNYVPALTAGNYEITVTHTLQGITTGSLGAVQNMVVSAPQFAVDPNMVLNRYPPANSTGPYDRVLPHIVLNDALLPWERAMTGPSDQQGRTPWLALLVLGEDELTGGEQSPTRSQTTTVDGFLATDGPVLKPQVTREGDVAGTDPCTFIEISADRFPQLLPRLAELRFLTHCRQSSIADKAEQGLETNGLFSAVIANRFPAPPSTTAPGPRKSIVHLVSLEGLEKYLVDQPDFSGHTSVALVSLASWTFQTTADPGEDFRALMENLVDGEYHSADTARPELLWLRLGWNSMDASAPGVQEVGDRFDQGFVPLGYRLRTGEDTLAWYRGPCAPVRTTPPPRSGRTPYPSADAALVYQEEYGVFDASRATAWQAGRSLALADRAFAQALHDLRRRAHQLTDRLLQQRDSDTFPVTAASQLTVDARAQNTLLTRLSAQLLTDLNTSVPTAPVTSPTTKPASTTTPVDPTRAVTDFLGDSDALKLIAQAAQGDLAPVAVWLARLRLLYPLPFPLLVPDDRLLPPESLRFFHLDENWIAACVDGALSIATLSSRDTLLNKALDETIQRAVREQAVEARAQSTGTTAPATPADGDAPVCGFLLRSAVVSGWPNLAIRGYEQDGTTLVPLLRLDRLSRDLLLCLFAGVPDHVDIAEPQEGFRFGVDDDGHIPLRRPTGTSDLGEQLQPATLPTLFPDQLRSGGLRVLDIGGAIPVITSALSDAGAPVTEFGPADFALQMVKSPEALRFTSQQS
ncbi:hypothetical protein ACFVIM_03435 [Streptomyces sp. NPDC057638]|uniref:hypothetical protein n=1 Tax=Streptomyces sp. NPDC057638 TaxID=3346190 RepID=UPI0036B13BD3